ncbi:MAG: hypothetical protein WDO13_19330 [Verrucomicrobiota bacterium]
MKGHFEWMWVWWGLTVAICSWKIVEAFVRPARMLEWPFLACAMWVYFYGYMAYQAKLTLSAYLGNGMADIGQLMALLCLIALLAGWSMGRRTRITRKPPQIVYNYFHFWLAGYFFLLVGAAGGIWMQYEAQIGQVHYEGDGYWYMLFYVGYPGLAMTVWSVIKMNRAMRHQLLILTLIGLAIFMAPHVIYARRGPLYPAVMVLLLVPPMTLRRPPNPLLYGGALVGAAIVMLLFLQVRTVTYNGGSWSQAIGTLDLNAAIEERGKEADDNEYVNNCQMIATIYKNGKYDYGTGHLGLLLHWVPRQVWKDKPGLGGGIYAADELFDDIERTTGFALLGHTGASSAGVADSFLEYGLLAPLFWFLLSWGFGSVYCKAIVVGSPRWMFCYVGIICASHWLVSQSFAAAFVPAMYFQAVPFVSFLLLGHLGAVARPPVAPRRIGPAAGGGAMTAARGARP